MAETFGARLRQQRERQLITLSSIAERTKIGLSLLEGLERDDVSHWPMGIFRRSFIRGYAQAIGLDPAEVVREFLEIHPDPEGDGAVAPPAADVPLPGQRPPTRLRCLFASAFPFLSGVLAPVPGPPDVRTPEVTAPRLDLRIRTPKTARLRDDVPTVEATAAQVADDVPTREAGAASAAVTVAAPGPAATSRPAVAGSTLESDLAGLAQLCTDLSRALAIRDVAPLLGRAASLIDAVGLIVWVWDPRAAALTPALTHGYADSVLAKLPRVRRDTDNATAAAFRSAETRTVAGSDLTNGALVVPLVTPGGCVGVLAAELRNGGEGRESVRAVASIVAAQLATFVGFEPLAEAVNT